MDKYARVKKIGEGSFGKALLVKHKETGKQFVVKEINMAKMGNKERGEARKETAVLAQLSHPNIVTYRESFEEVGNLYIVMDFCEGGDLYGRINMQRGVLLAEDMILDWFVQICLSIKHIHDRKILHRDIKSQNIFLTRHGIVKLGDFGIAKVLNSTVELARTCIGTPYYLSPEICENKPYNNKSDIWSLGCVLYELCTLKHAFEAGNMKNLVLKIIRGSFPPVSAKYSYELRNLIALLFKRNPRDRPSAANILRKPLLTNRIKKFLSQDELADEFSHTVLHGQVIKKALPAGRNKPQPVKAAAAARKPPSPSPRYNPVSVYAPSVGRQSKDRPRVQRSGDNKVVNKRPVSGGAAGNGLSDLARRRQELMKKEEQRREQKKKEAAKAHKELLEKQKIARINKAREEGWKGLLGSLPSDEKPSTPSPRVSVEESRRAIPSPVPQYKPVIASPNVPYVARDRGNYEKYHAFLDKLEQDRKSVSPSVYSPSQAAPSPYCAKPSVPPAAGFDPQNAAMHGQAAGVQGARAANHARVVEEYLERKAVAARNKNMGGAGVGAAVAVGSPRPVSAREVHRQQAEEDYLAKLRQIRLQNFNERRLNQDQGKSGIEQSEAELRKKKIEALRKQADERAEKLKAELEKKRKEAQKLKKERNDLEAKQQLERQQKVPEHRQVKPVKPPVPMTEAMKAIGVQRSPPKPVVAPKPAIGMTAAMEAIGAAPIQDPGGAPKVSDSKTPLQKKKAQILKRLNSKSTDAATQDNKSKWGQPVSLGQIALSETGSQMEVTSARDVVIKHSDLDSIPDVSASAPSGHPVSARKNWGSPGQTALNALGQAPIVHDDEATASASSRKHWAGPGQTVLDALSEAAPEKQTAADSSQARKAWGAPGGTVIKALNAVNISPCSSTLGTDDGSVEVMEHSDKITTNINTASHEGDEQLKAPVIGSTITITKTPGKGTVVIRRADTAEAAIADDGITDRSPSDRDLTGAGTEKTVHKNDKDDTDDETSEKADTEDNEKESSDQKLFEKIGHKEDDEENVQVGASIILEDIDDTVENSNNPEYVTDSNAHQSTNPDLDDKKVHSDIALDEAPNLKETPDEDNDSMSDRERGPGECVENVYDDKECGEERKDLPESDLRAGDTAKATILNDTSDIKSANMNSALLAKGLSTGHFDIAATMLRTCSEPDLSKLFKTANDPFPEFNSGTRKSIDLDELIKAEKDLDDLEEVVEKEEGFDEESDIEGNEVIQLVKENNNGSTSESNMISSTNSNDAIDKEPNSEPTEVELAEKLKGSGESKDEGLSGEGSKSEGAHTTEGDTSGDDESDELETLRESMMQVLNKSEDEEEELPKKTLKPKKKKKGVLKKTKLKKKKIKDVGDGSGDATDLSAFSSNQSNLSGSEEELRTLKNALRSLLESGTNPVRKKKNKVLKKKKKKLVSSQNSSAENTKISDSFNEIQKPSEESKNDHEDSNNIDDEGDEVNEEVLITTLVPGTETWQSDSEGNDDDEDDYFEEQDMFSRLEASRANLETELGEDVFIKAYKTVQAIHEDEDENMEEGIQLVTSILGDQKSHLYPSILQLVMADGAFAEDND